MNFVDPKEYNIPGLVRKNRYKTILPSEYLLPQRDGGRLSFTWGPPHPEEERKPPAGPPGVRGHSSLEEVGQRVGVYWLKGSATPVRPEASSFPHTALSGPLPCLATCCAEPSRNPERKGGNDSSS